MKTTANSIKGHMLVGDYVVQLKPWRITRFQDTTFKEYSVGPEGGETLKLPCTALFLWLWCDHYLHNAAVTWFFGKELGVEIEMLDNLKNPLYLLCTCCGPLYSSKSVIYSDNEVFRYSARKDQCGPKSVCWYGHRVKKWVTCSCPICRIVTSLRCNICKSQL